MRVAIDNLGSTEPSSAAAPRRFSPVVDSNGRRVPVLYAGEDLECALGETVFHDLPDSAAVPAEIFRADLLTLRAGTITSTVDLVLADLTDPALALSGYARTEVVDTPPGEYETTGEWGQHTWDTTEAAGIAWNSRRTPDRHSYLLFVTARTVTRRQLRVIQPPVPLYDQDGLAAVMEAAATRNVTVVL